MNILFLAAVLPGLYLINCVYRMDKIEKEPFNLLMRLAFFGALGVFVASVLESTVISGLEAILDKKSTVFLLIENFLCVAFVEEIIKYKILKRTWNDPALDYCFDGIVYAVCTGMGFAILENVFYVFQHGMEVAILRAITSLPGHCIFAIYMGYYYGMAKLCEASGNLKEKESNLSQALWVPVLLHGFYDYSLSANNEMLILGFIAFVIILDIQAYKKLKYASANDKHI